MLLKQRIHRDARRVAGDREAAALLACLVKNLFDPDLDATFLGKTCGAGREVRDRLAAAVGPLKGYIVELRMIEAGRLVRETDLSNAQIGERVGYPVVRTLYRAFKECHHLTPGEMRKRARAERAAPPEPAAAAAAAASRLEAGEATAATPEGGWEPAGGPRTEGRPERKPERLTPRARAARLRRRAAIGLLDAGAGGQLRSRLRHRHPKVEEAAGDPDCGSPDCGSPAGPRYPLILMPTGDHLERFAAGAVFDRILALPEADLRQAMLDGVRTGTSTAFEVLLELCYGHTRWNPEGAVAVAELGVQWLELHREMMADKAGDWKALAWAGLGRVKMLASDFAGAGRALGFAWEEIQDGEEMAPWVEREVRRVEGAVLMHQGRGDRAAAALDRAVELGRGLPLSDPARALSVSERLELASFLGDASAGIELSAELEALVDAGAAGIERVDFWRGLVAYHRGKAKAAAGRDDLAEQSWRQASQHVAADQDATEPPGAAVYETAVLGSFVVHELARLAGRLVASDRHLEVYEILLRDALERYRLVRAPVFEAAAEAELAALCAWRGQAEECRRLAAWAADFLDALPCHRRAWNAAGRLRALAKVGAGAPADEPAGVRPTGGQRNLLAALCEDLDSVRWEITGAQAAPAAAARRAGA